MPIIPTQSDPIQRWTVPSDATKATAKNLIADPRFDYDSLWFDGGHTIVADGDVRIDHQGSYERGGVRHHNLQVQKGRKTIAHVDVSESVQTVDPANQRGVMRYVRSTLKKSLYDGHSYFITGSIP